MIKIQKQVDDWAQQFKVPYWKPYEILARLMEEVGELAREVNHRYGHRIKKPTEKKKELEDEICDIMFTLICLANSLDIDLEASFENTVAKVSGRDTKRYEKR